MVPEHSIPIASQRPMHQTDAIPRSALRNRLITENLMDHRQLNRGVSLPTNGQKYMGLPHFVHFYKHKSSLQ